MSTIDQFKAALVGGGARPNQFRVDAVFPSVVPGTAVAGTLAQFMIQGASLPGSKVTKLDVPFRGRKLPVAGEREFEAWTIKVTNDTNFALHDAFNSWMNVINKVRDNTGVTAPSAYTTDMLVHQLDRNGVALKSYKMVGVWPSDVSEIELDFSSDEVETFNVTFELLYWQDNHVTGGV